jgi:hypothetical protein
MKYVLIVENSFAIGPFKTKADADNYVDKTNSDFTLKVFPLLPSAMKKDKQRKPT